jgi:dTDP-4-dehydrorhamnose 3,5-epimerase
LSAALAATTLPLPGLMRLEPAIHGDMRGQFSEIWNQRSFAAATQLDTVFVQDNLSRSVRGVLRGLHYQIDPHAQGKLVCAIEGEIWDVVVDLRKNSPGFGQWHGVHLNGAHLQSLWVPPGFAHGYVVLSATATVLYKASAFYAQAHERCLRYDDATLDIAWPGGVEQVVSAKDMQGLSWQDAPKFD